MKKLIFTLGTLFMLLFSGNALAGATLGNLGDLGPAVATPNPVAQPNSRAYGRSLDAWVEAYLRTLFEGEAIPAKNVAFLPILGDPPFYVQVKPGTALVLPIALWLGFEGDPELGPSSFSAVVTLDGQQIVGADDDTYYVAPTYVDPPILGLVTFYEGLAVVIKPLTPGEHTIVLDSSINLPGGTATFHNDWVITVTQ